MTPLIEQLPAHYQRSPQDAELQRVLSLLADQLQADKELEFAPVYLLDEDRAVAMEKMAAIHELERQLPGLLCGSCGAPSCHAFAEDVVLGRADRSDCIFQVRARVQKETGADMDEYLPAPFRRQRPEEKKDT